VLSLNRNLLIIVGIVAITLVALVFVTTPRESAVLPDRYAHFEYSFSYPDIAEEVDKSKELKAWIGYDENFLKRPFARYVEINRNWLPNYSEVQNLLNEYPIVERILVERKDTWISTETARSLVEYYWKNDGPVSGHCGQYNYIQTYVLYVPRSKDDIAFVPVVLPNPAMSCYPDRLLEEAYGPLLDSPSIEQPRILDFAKLLEMSYEFVCWNLLPLTVTPVVLGALIWRGKIRRIWLANGFGYKHFELMVKMRGSKTRLQILRTFDIPKTRQYIAHELNLDWKAVDTHVKALLKYGLIKEMCSVGQTTYYTRSESGDKLLELLKNDFSESSDGNKINFVSICIRKLWN